MNRNKTVKTITTSLLTGVVVVLLSAGSAFATKAGVGYIHKLYVKNDGTVLFQARDENNNQLFDGVDGCYQSSNEYIHLGTASTPASRAQFLKILATAQVTKSRMAIRIECFTTDIQPSLFYLVFDD